MNDGGCDISEEACGSVYEEGRYSFGQGYNKRCELFEPSSGRELNSSDNFFIHVSKGVNDSGFSECSSSNNIPNCDCSGSTFPVGSGDPVQNFSACLHCPTTCQELGEVTYSYNEHRNRIGNITYSKGSTKVGTRPPRRDLCNSQCLCCSVPAIVMVVVMIVVPLTVVLLFN